MDLKFEIFEFNEIYPKIILSLRKSIFPFMIRQHEHFSTNYRDGHY